MGPDIINNKTGKPHMQLSIWCNNNFNQSWSCYHDADDMCKFMQFLIKVDKRIMKQLSPWWKEKGCHGDEYENDATTTYRLSGSPRGYRCKRKSDGSVQEMVGWSRIPGVPRVSGMENEWQYGHGADKGCISSNMHSCVHGCRLGVIPLKRVFSKCIESA